MKMVCVLWRTGALSWMDGWIDERMDGHGTTDSSQNNKPPCYTESHVKLHFKNCRSYPTDLLNLWEWKNMFPL